MPISILDWLELIKTHVLGQNTIHLGNEQNQGSISKEKGKGAQLTSATASVAQGVIIWLIESGWNSS